MTAFLRIYEPLDVWQEPPTPGGDLASRERAAALRAASALPPRIVGDLDLEFDAEPAGPAGQSGGGERFTGSVLSPVAPDGVVRVCPADLTWRALLAIEELRLTTAPPLLYSFLPAATVTQAGRQLAERTPSGTSSAPHVLSSNWRIPLAWFAAFQPEQRVMGEDTGADPGAVGDAPTDAGSGRGTAAGSRASASGTASTQADGDRRTPPLRSAPRALRYLAPMADARRCVARALAAVRRVRTDLLAAGELEGLGRWLEEFHARSVVELDYAGLVGLFGDIDGVDDSVTEVAAAIADLRTTSSEHGIERLTVVHDRWAALRAVGRAS